MSQESRAIGERQGRRRDAPLAPSPQTGWRGRLSLAGLSALIAASLPIATFVHGWIQKDKELALEREKQVENVRTAYLDRLKDGDSRERVLRLIIATAEDPRMRVWAEEELKRVEAAQKALEEEIRARSQTAADSCDPAAYAHIADLEALLGKPVIANTRRTAVRRDISNCVRALGHHDFRAICVPGTTKGEEFCAHKDPKRDKKDRALTFSIDEVSRVAGPGLATTMKYKLQDSSEKTFPCSCQVQEAIVERCAG